MGHVEVANYQVNNYRLVGNQYSVDLSKLQEITPNILLGHIHKPDDIYVGSLTQLTFNDVGNTQGFVVYDLNTSEKVRIPVTAPEYKILGIDSVEDLPETLDGNDFYRLDVDMSIKVENLKSLLENNNITFKLVDKSKKEFLGMTLKDTEISSEKDLLLSWLEATEYAKNKNSLVSKLELLITKGQS